MADLRSDSKVGTTKDQMLRNTAVMNARVKELAALTSEFTSKIDELKGILTNGDD